MNHLLHTLATASILVLLAACGGSGSGSSSDADPTAAALPAETPAGGSPPAADPGTGGSPPPSAPGPGAVPPSAAPSPAPGPGTTPPTTPPTVPATPTAIAKLYIDTVGSAEIIDKEEYIDATLRIESEVEGENLTVATEIRGRGNATWTMPKKPYRLKLASASSVLGMPAEKDWALLANYADKTMARNKLAMTMGERMGMVWTPRSRFVELYFNGRYDGVYQVFEHVKTGTDRVDVGDLDENEVDPVAITGGWLLEVDVRKGEDVCWETNSSIWICVKSPGLELDDVNTAGTPAAGQLNYIRDYFNAAEAALHRSGDEWRTYFDVPAVIDWYLVNEVMRNFDAHLVSSVYLHKQAGKPLVFGPLWDFDIAGGNFDYGDAEKPTGWWVRNDVWHSKMFDRANFRLEVFQRWCALKRDNLLTGAGLGGIVDQTAATIGVAPIARNFQRWPVLGTRMDPFHFSGATTHQGELDYLKTWLADRVTWMDGEYRTEFGECPVVVAAD